MKTSSSHFASSARPRRRPAPLGVRQQQSPPRARPAAAAAAAARVAAGAPRAPGRRRAAPAARPGAPAAAPRAAPAARAARGRAGRWAARAAPLRRLRGGDRGRAARRGDLDHREPELQRRRHRDRGRRRGHSGTKSVKVTGKGGYCDHVFIANTAAVTAVGKSVYGRFFLRLSSPLGQGHTTLLTLKDAVEGKISASAGKTRC